MSIISRIDLDKVKRFISVINIPYPGETGNSADYQPARTKAFADMRSGGVALMNYYYTEIEPDNGERNHPGTGDRPYNMTKTERALKYIENGDNQDGAAFAEKYLGKLTQALNHYEQKYQSDRKEALEKALKETLGNMTGEQFLILLDEYDRRKNDNSH